VSRVPKLGPRGEGWVALQFVLLAVTAWAGTLGPAWGGSARLATTLAGGALLGAGGVLAIRGLFDLRASLTPLPRPLEDGELVEHGAYRLVRHPIYGGIILCAFGYGLIVASPAAILAAVLLLGFFDLKSRREETWLVDHYPGYAAYRERTRRLLPWLY
jgi:protein-S-isoprenylcysteine O-methyltransferase Ste14